MFQEILPQKNPHKLPDAVVIALISLVGRTIAVAVKKAKKEKNANELCEAKV